MSRLHQSFLYRDVTEGCDAQRMVDIIGEALYTGEYIRFLIRDEADAEPIRTGRRTVYTENYTSVARRILRELLYDGVVFASISFDSDIRFCKLTEKVWVRGSAWLESASVIHVRESTAELSRAGLELVEGDEELYGKYINESFGNSARASTELKFRAEPRQFRKALKLYRMMSDMYGNRYKNYKRHNIPELTAVAWRAAFELLIEGHTFGKTGTGARIICAMRDFCDSVDMEIPATATLRIISKDVVDAVLARQFTGQVIN